MVKLTKFTDRPREAGFTLVELAVVMIIIGLLIGGVLKGQELIANAQVAATVAQVKAFDAATTTFRDMFDAMPGDMATPNTRLPNCTAVPCSTAGDGDRRVEGTAADPFSAAPGGELLPFWAQLNAADLVSGIDPNRGNVWGGTMPAAKIGGGFVAGYWVGNALMTGQGTNGLAANVRAGHYLALHNNVNGPMLANSGFLTANQAFRIDSKLDDGVPSSGSVMAAGIPAGPNGCATAAAPGGVYNERLASAVCNLYIRFQN
jgi:prepilin-type N-terminal cleavage/methylation domain-containing protein